MKKIRLGGGAPNKDSEKLTNNERNGQEKLWDDSLPCIQARRAGS